MASAKNVVEEKSPKLDDKKESVEVVKKAEAANPGGPAAKAPLAVPQRSSSAKEVIPFEWKLIGESQGFALILFKAIERDEVEAQLERVQRDGYYGNLRIIGNTEQVKQPASAKARRERQTAASTKAVERSIAEAKAKKEKAEAKLKASSVSKTKPPVKRPVKPAPKKAVKKKAAPKIAAPKKAAPKIAAPKKAAKKSKTTKTKAKTAKKSKSKSKAKVKKKKR